MITSITLKNFRIYKNQLLLFPKNGMILIAGPNGSGKSSIGMAIGLALNLDGFHKYRQEKGFNINDLIKEDSDECLIELELNNESINGIKPFPFIDSKIKLERKLNRYQSGTNIKILADGRSFRTYQQFYEESNFQPSSSFLYIPQGKLGDLIPTKRGGVSQINYFDEFIRYIALTEDQELQNAHENYQKAKAILETFAITHFNPAEEEILKLKDQFNQYKAFVLKKDSELSSAMLLHSVLQLRTEKKIKRLLDEKQTIGEIINQVKNELIRKSTELESLELDSLRESIENANNYILQLGKDIQPLALELIVIETAYRNYQKRIKELKSDIYGDELELNGQTDLLQETQKQLKGKDGKEQESTLKLLKERKKQLDQCITKIKEIEQDFEKNKDQFNEQKQNVLLERKELKQYRTELITKLGSLAKSKDGNIIENFPKHIKKLNQIIREKNLDIVGPAALYVKVKNSKHVSLVEIALGANFLFGYCTENLGHQRLLDRIILQNRIENVNVYYFDPNNRDNQSTLSQNSSSPTFSGIIGKIKDLIHIEQPLIELMIKEFPSRNWIACSSTQAAENVALKYHKTGIAAQLKNSALIKRPLRSSNGMVTVFRRAKLQVLSGFDFTEDINKTKEEIQSIDEQLNTVESNIQSIDDKISTLVDIKDEQIGDLKQEEFNFRKTIAELEALLGEKNLSIALIEQKITGLEAEITKSKKILETEEKQQNKVETQLQEYQSKINNLVDQRNESEQLLGNYSLELKEKKEKETELIELIGEIEEKLRDHKSERDDIESAFKEYQIELKKEVKQTQNYKEKIIECIKPIKEHLENLRENKHKSSWIDIFESEIHAFEGSLRLLKDKNRLETFSIDKLEHDYYLAKATQDIELEDVIIDRYDYARELLQEQKTRKELLEIENNLRDEEYKNAYKKWYEIVNRELEKLKKGFQKLIQEVSGRGHIEVRNLSQQRSEKRPIMNLKVSFHKGTSPRSITSHLHSGGESTLILLAFILSLHSLRTQPVYFFDEPDAHLDPKNRDKLFKMIKAASSKSQYFVFSPQDFEEKHEVPDSVYYVFKTDDDNVIVKEIT